MDNFADSVLSVRHEGSFTPAQDVECNMPETKEAKGNPKVDTKSVQDPSEVSETFGCLKVIREEEVVHQGDDEPHEVGAVEEEGAGDQLDPPAGRRHVGSLGGHPGGLGLLTLGLRKLRAGSNLTWSTQAWLSKKDPLGPVPATPPGIS